MIYKSLIASVFILIVFFLVVILRADYSERQQIQEEKFSFEGNILYGSTEGNHYAAMDSEKETYLISTIDTTRDSQLKMPYYGELIKIYTESGQYNKAATIAEQRALASDQALDYKVSGSLYFQAALKIDSEEIRKDTARKAKSMYIRALEKKAGDPNIMTDLAVVYMSLLKPDESFLLLDDVIRHNPEHIRANFNMGVLLFQTGRASHGIPFLEKALSQARDTEWESVVQNYLDRHHAEIYH